VNPNERAQTEAGAIAVVPPRRTDQASLSGAVPPLATWTLAVQGGPLEHPPKVGVTRHDVLE
jgi:hypothetical protein